MTWFVFTVAERLAAEVDELDKHAPAFYDADPEATDALELLAKVRDIRQKLHDVEQYIEREAAVRMGQKRVEWEQGFAVRRKTAKRVRWDNADIASAVLVSAMVDENGELPGEEANLVACRVKETLVRCAGLDAASFSSWRVGELEKVGIEADSYRHSEPGRWTVDVQLGTGESA